MAAHQRPLNRRRTRPLSGPEALARALDLPEEEVQAALEQPADPVKLLLLEPLADHVILVFLGSVILDAHETLSPVGEQALVQIRQQLSRLMDAYQIRPQVRARLGTKDPRLQPAFDRLLAPEKETA